MRRMLFAAAMLAAVLGAIIFPAASASAHGHTTVGDYELVIGFRVEPAFQGEPNGLDLRVTNKTTKEPVKDLGETLRAEIIYGASKREVAIRPQWGQDGAYTADVLPSEAGDYTWHIWGDLNGTPLDVTMTSGEKTFGAVKAKSETAFPTVDATPAELSRQAADAAQSARTALDVAIAGVLVGAAGLAVGFLGWRAGRKPAPAAAATRSQRPA